jgi:predicted RNase H-related nuclease YkuK (DUF458 family)
MTKAQRVLKELKRRKLTAIQIIQLVNVTNPADIIYALRKKGHNITVHINIQGKKKWATYRLVQS